MFEGKNAKHQEKDTRADNKKSTFSSDSNVRKTNRETDRDLRQSNYPPPHRSHSDNRGYRDNYPNHSRGNSRDKTREHTKYYDDRHDSLSDKNYLREEKTRELPSYRERDSTQRNHEPQKKRTHDSVSRDSKPESDSRKKQKKETNDNTDRVKKTVIDHHKHQIQTINPVSESHSKNNQEQLHQKNKTTNNDCGTTTIKNKRDAQIASFVNFFSHWVTLVEPPKKENHVNIKKKGIDKLVNVITNFDKDKIPSQSFVSSIVSKIFIDDKEMGKMIFTRLHEKASLNDNLLQYFLTAHFYSSPENEFDFAVELLNAAFTHQDTKQINVTDCYKKVICKILKCKSFETAKKMTDMLLTTITSEKTIPEDFFKELLFTSRNHRHIKPNPILVFNIAISLLTRAIQLNKITLKAFELFMTITNAAYKTPEPVVISTFNNLISSGIDQALKYSIAAKYIESYSDLKSPEGFFNAYQLVKENSLLSINHFKLYVEKLLCHSVEEFKAKSEEAINHALSIFSKPNVEKAIELVIFSCLQDHKDEKYIISLWETALKNNLLFSYKIASKTISYFDKPDAESIDEPLKQLIDAIKKQYNKSPTLSNVKQEKNDDIRAVSGNSSILIPSIIEPPNSIFDEYQSQSFNFDHDIQFEGQLSEPVGENLQDQSNSNDSLPVYADPFKSEQTRQISMQYNSQPPAVTPSVNNFYPYSSNSAVPNQYYYNAGETSYPVDYSQASNTTLLEEYPLPPAVPLAVNNSSSFSLYSNNSMPNQYSYGLETTDFRVDSGAAEFAHLQNPQPWANNIPMPTNNSYTNNTMLDDIFIEAVCNGIISGGSDKNIDYAINALYNHDASLIQSIHKKFYNKSILMLAIEYERLSIIKILVENYFADPFPCTNENSTIEIENSPAYRSLLCVDKQISNYIFSSTKHIDTFIAAAFTLAINKGHVDAIKTLVELRGIVVNNNHIFLANQLFLQASEAQSPQCVNFDAIKKYLSDLLLKQLHAANSNSLSAPTYTYDSNYNYSVPGRAQFTQFQPHSNNNNFSSVDQSNSLTHPTSLRQRRNRQD